MNRKKLLFLIHDLGGGGAEKVLVNLVNHMNENRYDITVLSIFDVGENRRDLADHIHYQAAISKMIPGNSHLMKLYSPESLYRRMVKGKYDLVVSFLEGPVARVTAGCKIEHVKIVSWIHCSMQSKADFTKSFRTFKEACWAYNKADVIVFVSEDSRTAFEKVCPVTTKTQVLYNVNDSDRILKLAEEIYNDPDLDDPNCFCWCSVGKITHEKGFDRLISMQKRLYDQGFKTHFYAIGTGKDEDKYKKWCDEQGIAQTVTFCGYQANPYRILKRCELFVCASHSEGFSTAATEALILGIPVLTTAVSGMKEMLGDNEYGIITDNDIKPLYKALKGLITNPELLSHYRDQAIKRGQIFSTKQTVMAVEEFFDDLLS